MTKREFGLYSLAATVGLSCLYFGFKSILNTDIPPRPDLPPTFPPASSPVPSEIVDLLSPDPANYLPVGQVINYHINNEKAWGVDPIDCEWAFVREEKNKPHLSVVTNPDGSQSIHILGGSVVIYPPECNNDPLAELNWNAGIGIGLSVLAIPTLAAAFLRRKRHHSPEQGRKPTYAQATSSQTEIPISHPSLALIRPGISTATPKGSHFIPGGSSDIQGFAAGFNGEVRVDIDRNKIAMGPYGCVEPSNLKAMQQVADPDSDWNNIEYAKGRIANFANSPDHFVPPATTATPRISTPEVRQLPAPDPIELTPFEGPTIETVYDPTKDRYVVVRQ